MANFKCGTSASGKKFIPLLFGGDINVYSMARAFYESYGCISKAYGKYPTGPCMNSAILDYTANEGADEKETFFELARSFADENKDSAVLLIGCGDSYVELASICMNRFPKNVIVPCIGHDLMQNLIDKENFYKLCAEIGIDYPDTFVYKRELGELRTLPFPGPFIVKPSSGIEYWKHPYPSQKKVYREETIQDVNRVLSDIYGAGYRDSVIIQNFIPGDDSCMRVLTCYSDRNGKTVMMCLGHVILEEHTPHGLGNHAVIITERDEELMEKYKKFLEGMHYVGFSNFDIKYDRRDGKYKTFEINIRQGRSNFYVTASGANLAEILTEDRLDEKDMTLRIADEEMLWSVIPKKVAYAYANKAYTKKMKALVKAGKFSNPLLCSAEKNPKKLFATAKNMMSHYVKFKKYLGKTNEKV